MRYIFHRIAGRHELPKSYKRSRVIAVTLVAVLMLSFSLPVFAAALPQNTQKQEVVYINLNADGSVRDISVVNIFELSEAGEITDHGAYTSLRNMTTNDAIAYEHETVRIRTRAGKLYYEGALKSRVAPWDVSIRYTLDGAAYTAEALGGRTGKLQITLAVRQNTDCDPTFFEHYGLQAVITLDTKLCKNIIADGATQANVGADRQLSYTILPGKEKEIVITADVTDFEMKGITLNALPLHLDVDVDTENNESFNEQITELEDGVTELDDGAIELRDGADELRDGAKELQDGAIELRDGAIELTEGAEELGNGTGTLYSGISELDNGLQELCGGVAKAGSGAYTLQEGLKTLSGQSAALTDGAYDVFKQLTSQAETQLNAILTPIGLPAVHLAPETYEAVLTSLAAQIPDDNMRQAVLALKAQLDGYNAFYRGLFDYTAGVDKAAGGAAELAGGASSLASGVSKLKGGTKELLRGASALLDGAIELHDGTVELKDGAVTLLDGVNTLCDGTDELYDGTVELTDGTGEFRDKTANLDTDVKEEVNDAIHDALGGDFDVVSFVSADNENVESVQFVIKTDGIDGTEKVTVDTISAEPLTFWEKLLALFGWR